MNVSMNVTKNKSLVFLAIGFLLSFLLGYLYRIVAEYYGLVFGEFISTIILMILALPMLYGASICLNAFKANDNDD